MNKRLLLSAIAASALTMMFTGCTSDGTNGVNGVDGINGTNGTDGIDGTTVYYESSTSDYRTPYQDASEQILLAEGLSVEYLTRDAANKTDQMTFWPAENPTHIITCIEGSSETLDNGKKNPSVQAIDLLTGDVETLLRGMSGCDGIRTTPWGTVLATEEKSDGGAYEIIDPLSLIGDTHTVTDRATGAIVASDGTTAATKIVKRTALPTMSWEGLVILENGVVMGGDELRPGSYADTAGSDDTDGGAIFKFVPTTPRTALTDVADLSESPLVGGNVYAMQVQCNDGDSQHGQGCEIGNAIWVAVDGANARASANDAEATGYYRPEDMHLDPTYEGEGIRFCWANTGNPGAESYSEVLCGVDTDPADIASDDTTIVNRFVEGDSVFNSADNLAFQAGSGNLYVIEDHSNGDIWACLPDGDDRDIKTDGCVRLLSVNDSSAEPTGFMFAPDGKTAYLSIQHSSDGNIEKVDGYGTDDILKISGFSVPDKAYTANFGADRDAMLHANANEYFGFSNPKTSSASTQVDRNTTAAADEVIELAGGLTATFLTRDAANTTDQMAFWPAENPTHLITCIEGSAQVIDGGSKLNPSVQAIDLLTGNVETLVRGMSGCDGIRTTPWGTVLATEEKSDGGAYEIIDPLSLIGNTNIVTSRSAGTIVQSDGTTPATNIIKRTALPTMSWEGLVVLESGVVMGGDELRPGSYTGNDGREDTDGGAIFKFIPTTERTATTAIANLSESPLVDGSVYAMQVQCNDGDSQHGQGCEIGNAIWVAVDGADARSSANDAEATGYYRPEDMHLDPTYEGEGIRFCWANTGNPGAENYSEVICGVDSDPMDIASDDTTIINRFVEGDGDMDSADNLAFDPATGNLYVIEDQSNHADIWACLPDGNDRDIKTDGCVRLLSLTDTSAEPTGFTFSPDGSTAYVSIQHSNDSGIAKVDDYGTDDIIKITGFNAAGNNTFNDFGNKVEDALKVNAKELFGFDTPVSASSTK